MITEVYRFENKDGEGVYRGSHTSRTANELKDKLGNAHNGHPDRPHTWTDFTSRQTELIDCAVGLHGCPSVETFKEWFDGFVESFVKCKEIQLVKYKAKKVVIGKSGLQCLFEPLGEGVILKGKELDKFLN